MGSVSVPPRVRQPHHLLLRGPQHSVPLELRQELGAGDGDAAQGGSAGVVEEDREVDGVPCRISSEAVVVLGRGGQGCVYFAGPLKVLDSNG